MPKKKEKQIHLHDEWIIEEVMKRAEAQKVPAYVVVEELLNMVLVDSKEEKENEWKFEYNTLVRDEVTGFIGRTSGFGKYYKVEALDIVDRPVEAFFEEKRLHVYESEDE